jgi:hypothetical protein
MEIIETLAMLYIFFVNRLEHRIPPNFKLHRYADWEIFAQFGEVRMEVKLLLTTIH